jgi:hypothetical protein
LPAAKAGRMESSSGSARATPAPRRKVRRDNGRGAGGKVRGMGPRWGGQARGRGT